jgi:hypothetical protein
MTSFKNHMPPSLVIIGAAALGILLAVGGFLIVRATAMQDQTGLAADGQVAPVQIFFERVREPVEDTQGNVLGELCYERIVLSDDTKAATAINDYFAAEARAFFDGDGKSRRFPLGTREDFLRSVAQWRESLGDVPLSESPLYCVVNMAVTHADKDILSVRENFFWMGGGVSNLYYYGDTFDLATGELLTLDCFVDEDAADFNAMALEAIQRDLGECFAYYDQSNDTTKRISALSLADYEFYFDSGGDLYLIFNQEVYSDGGYILPFQHRLV